MLRSGRPWGRRALATFCWVSSTVSLGVVAPASAPATATVAPVLRLAADGSGVRALDVALASTEQTVEATSFSMLGLTWRGAPRAIRVQTRADGVWSTWRDLEHLTDVPEPRAEGVGVAATDLLWVGRADAVRVDVAGPRPESLTLVLLDPVDAATSVPAARAAPTRKRPSLLSRGAWGADPALRSGSPSYNRTIQQVHVHHTVNSNDYRRRDVPGLLRGIYRYHTQNLGWSDIGYNFLVDRFGRTWIGRGGGAWKSVRGAHTLGFNSTSTGVAVIGDFEDRRPSASVLTALVRLSAWKLYRHDRDPAGRVRVYSHGSDRFAPGRIVTLPTIDAHRDTNQTACPGSRLARRLPEVRRRAAERIARWLEDAEPGGRSS